MSRYYCIVILIFFSTNFYCQRPPEMAFTLLKFTEKVDFCDSDYKYTTHMVPKGIDYGLRSKINTKRRKGLEKQLNKKIYQQYLL